MSVDVTGIGTGLQAIQGILGKFLPDKTEAQRAEIAAELALVQGQLDTNKVEAASASVFVAGWRPWIGWVCGAGCAWNWVLLPIAKAGLKLSGIDFAVSPADMSEMMPLLMGMLGMGGLRTIEKINGVARH